MTDSTLGAADRAWATPFVVRLEDVQPERLKFSQGTIAQLLGPQNGIDHFEIHVSVIESGSPAGVYHVHPTAQSFYFVLAGRLLFRLDGIDHELGPQALVYIPAGVPHSVTNLGPGHAQLLGAYAPAGDQLIPVEGGLSV